MEIILAFKAINLTKTKTYESELDEAKGTDDSTKFLLGAIDTRTMSYIVDSNMDVTENDDGKILNKFNQLTVAYNLVKFGLKGFTNYQDSEGADVPYKQESINYGGKSYKVVTEAILSSMPTTLIMELAGQINDINTVSEDDSKN